MMKLFNFKFRTLSLTAIALVLAFSMSSLLSSVAVAALVGEWHFDDAQNPLQATLGNDLTFVGNDPYTVVEGNVANDGALRIPRYAHLKCLHGITPAAGETRVNEYTLVLDLRYPNTSAGEWISLYQTDLTNNLDGKLFIQEGTGAIGINAQGIGYSSQKTSTENWYRVVISVKNGTWFRVYVNGEAWRNVGGVAKDGSHALSADGVLIAADDNGEDFPLDLTYLAVYDHALSADEVCNLGLEVALAPLGEWRFDDPQNHLQATTGANLTQVGTLVEPIPGFAADDGAVRIGVGSYLNCTHGLPVSPGNYVNEYTLVWDISYPESSANRWKCLLQTNISNSNDGDLFIRNADRALGKAGPGYSGNATSPATWYRVVASIKNGTWFRLYVNGRLWLNGTKQGIDGTYALDPRILLMADDNGEDAPIDLSRFACYGLAMDEYQATSLGTPYPRFYDNQAPVVVDNILPSLTATPQQVVESTATGYDPDGTHVQVRFDWDDETLGEWTDWTSNQQAVNGIHTYTYPGFYTVRAQARDNLGQLSAWQEIQAITVTGEVPVTITTPPYLQNMSPSGMVIMYETVENISLEVRYGTTSAYGAAVITAREKSGGNTYIQRAILTDLEPQTRYHYRLYNSGGTPLTDDRTFDTTVTAPVDFAFSLWSDSQGHNHGVWTADPLEPTTSMMRHMAASGIAFGLTSGDLAENGASYSDTSQYYLQRVATHLGTVVPWYVAWGNHDSNDPNAPLRRFSDMPSRYRAERGSGHGCYTFTYAECFFVCLDYYHQAEITDGWLEQVLSSAEAQNARIRVLVNHVPAYCEVWLDGNATLRNNLVPLMEQYKVNLMVSGHTHEYARGYLNGVHYLITGGGSWLDFPEKVVKEWEHMTVGGKTDVPGLWAKESSTGVLGEPTPILRGNFNEYVHANMHGETLLLECQAFNADGSYIGILDAVSINTPKQRLCIWQGAGADEQWQTAANWSGATAPVDGDDLTFSGQTRQANVNSTLTKVGNVSFATPGFTISGDTLELQGNLSCDHLSGTTTWSTPLTLGRDVRLITTTNGNLKITGAIDNNGKELKLVGRGTTTLAGVISGSGTLTKSGSGRAILQANNTFSGTTTLAEGTLALEASGALDGEIVLAAGTCLDVTALTSFKPDNKMTFVIDPQQPVATIQAQELDLSAGEIVLDIRAPLTSKYYVLATCDALKGVKNVTVSGLPKGYTLQTITTEEQRKALHLTQFLGLIVLIKGDDAT